MHYGVAREDDQSHAILLESVEELVDGVFGAFEAVGLEILGEHRVRKHRPRASSRYPGSPPRGVSNPAAAVRAPG